MDTNKGTEESGKKENAKSKRRQEVSMRQRQSKGQRERRLYSHKWNDWVMGQR